MVATILNTSATIAEACLCHYIHLCVVSFLKNSKQPKMITAYSYEQKTRLPSRGRNKPGLDFGSIYEQYGGKIYHKCKLMLKDESAAEDLTQEIFIKIFLNLAGFENKSKFSTWVYAITHNSCIDFLRKKRRRKNREETRKQIMKQGAVLAETDPVMMEKKSEKVNTILARLSFSEEEILRMKYELNMSIRDIAAELDKSESAVKMKILRAKKKARKIKLETFSDN